MRRIGAFVPVIFVSGCLVGPDYVRVPPAHPPTASYKEAQAAPMTPAEAAAAARPAGGRPRDRRQGKKETGAQAKPPREFECWTSVEGEAAALVAAGARLAGRRPETLAEHQGQL